MISKNSKDDVARVARAEKLAQVNSNTAAALAKQGIRRAKNDRVWDWLKDVSDNLRSYMTGPAVLLPMLHDDALVASVEANGKAGDLAQLVRAMTRDAKVYAERFRDINAKHSSRRGSSTGADDMFQSITISQDYLQLTDSYNSVLMPTLQDILEIMETAGLNVSSVRALNGKLVYDMYKQKPEGDLADA
jgi:hypothetical protein